jgi:hypothetical protein
MLHHSRVATTTDVYMQSLEDGVRSTVNSIYDELSSTGTGDQNHPRRTGPTKQAKS